MNNIFLFKGFIILIVSIFCLSLSSLNTIASTPFKSKTTVSSEKTKIKSIRCNNCPCNCLIKPNQVGECGQYKNVDGKLTPVKKNSK